VTSSSLVVVGLNHKTAPVSLLEQLSISQEQLPKALHQLTTFDDVLEGVILSTCNRIEVYVTVSRFHAGSQDVRNFLAEFCHIAPEDLADHLYTYHDDGALRHLFRVASGIDSMVVGESEILGQVRRAAETARAEKTMQRMLGAAFRQALSVGKRARTDTAIGRNPVSVSSAAVELARRTFEKGNLKDTRVVIVGAGKMGHLTARALSQAGATDLVVVNRTEENAEALAALFAAEPLPLDALPQALGSADIVISSTTAPEVVLDRQLLEDTAEARAGRPPLLIIDIAVPRDVAPDAKDVPGVVVRDIDDLRNVVEEGRDNRQNEVVKVESIIATEVERFLEWQRSTEFAPTAAALVSAADRIREKELARALGQLDSLTEEQKSQVDHLTRRIIAKVLHTPLKKVREVAGSTDGYLYLATLREMFELDEDPDDTP
jgi:glutamyl-tRNA reductase